METRNWPAGEDGTVAPRQYESLCCAHMLSIAATDCEPELGWTLKSLFRIQGWISSCCESVWLLCFLWLCSLQLSNPLLDGGVLPISALLCEALSSHVQLMAPGILQNLWNMFLASSSNETYSGRNVNGQPQTHSSSSSLLSGLWRDLQALVWPCDRE